MKHGQIIIEHSKKLIQLGRLLFSTLGSTIITNWEHCQEAYEAYYRKRGASGRVYEDLQNVPETLRDVAYYKQMKFVDVETLYGIDSPANFIRFATDHYGELGLSRLNIFASNKR